MNGDSDVVRFTMLSSSRVMAATDCCSRGRAWLRPIRYVAWQAAGCIVGGMGVLGGAEGSICVA